MQAEIASLRQQLAASQARERTAVAAAQELQGEVVLQVPRIGKRKVDWEHLETKGRRDAVAPVMKKMRLVAEERGARPEQIAAHCIHRC